MSNFTGNPDKLSACLKAREITKLLFIEDASDIDIEAIAVERGVIVTEGLLSGVEGRLSILGPQGLITVKNNILEPGKKRFIIAHELGHFELHRTKVPTISCSDMDFYEWRNRKPLEVEANYFAAELLMPEEIFGKKIQGKLLTKDLLKSLVGGFQTSLTATAIRFATLRPEYALICSTDFVIKWFIINGEEFRYFLNTKGKVHSESLAHDFFKGEELPDSFFPVSPEAWIWDGRIRGRGQLKELSIGSRDYKQVLTFLYIDEDNDY